MCFIHQHDYLQLLHVTATCMEKPLFQVCIFLDYMLIRVCPFPGANYNCMFPLKCVLVFVLLNVEY